MSRFVVPWLHRLKTKSKIIFSESCICSCIFEKNVVQYTMDIDNIGLLIVEGGLCEKTICELFAEAGGSRLGFDRLDSGWETTWFSQWEPGAKTQWAHDCCVKHYGDYADLRCEYHTGEDINEMDKNAIPDHTLIVGGFPCQDYSVAHSLSSSKGIEGKKAFFGDRSEIF